MAAMLTPSLQHQLQSAFKGQSPSPTSKARYLDISMYNARAFYFIIFHYILYILPTVLGSWFKTGGKIKSFEIL